MSHASQVFPPDADPTNRYAHAAEWAYALLRVAAGLMLVPHVWPKLMAGPTAIAANVMARRGLETITFLRLRSHSL
jgi:uncharacterized membrane protein YphA (DoxX/SURF4 family)